MSKLFFIFILAVSNVQICSGQNSFIRWHSPDEGVSLEELSYQLTHRKKNELEKVRSIFYWITGNIRYGTAASHYGKNYRWYEPEEEGILKSPEERIARRVLRNRVGVCEGFSKLFKTLCDYSGIEAVTINGYASISGASQFAPNHSWNGVKIDGKWFLLDATWSSTNGGNYFLTHPLQFFQTHYPEDIRWALLDEMPVTSEFNRTPYHHKNFSKYQLTGYYPQRGNLKIQLGDTLHFQIQSGDFMNDKKISADMLIDKTVFENEESVILSPSECGEGRIEYSYVALNPEIKLIYLLYNNDLVLRYQLQVK